jgi:colicin import membrane protein
MKNTLPVLLGIALALLAIAYFQTEKANRQLAERLHQAEDRVKLAEAEIATLRDSLKTPKTTAVQLPAQTPGAVTPSSTPEAASVDHSADTTPESEKEASPGQLPSEAVIRAVQYHAGLLKTQVERAWRIPQGIPPNVSCIVRIDLLPAGQLQNVSLIESSGNAAFDGSALAAVKRASPFPMPGNPEVAARFRSFNFRFKPGS